MTVAEPFRGKAPEMLACIAVHFFETAACFSGINF